ncbi:MAG TPA: hypothetical protein PLB52_02050 [Candidatus Moranbacteria bacterium]|nr:hypothetical protein [Candidatus Moranbacteria bacterium]
MSLKDLNDELYNPNLETSKQTHEKSEYDPEIAIRQSASSPFDEQQIWNKPQKGLNSKQKKLAIIGGSALGIIILAVAGFFIFRWWQKNAFHQDRVEISIEGPNEADSTRINKYIVHYKNNNRVTLKDAAIKFDYSGNFIPAHDNENFKELNNLSGKIFIGDVKPKQEGTVELRGAFYAPKDFPVYLYASIIFVPSNGNQELSMKNQISVRITAAPIDLNISVPEQAVEGYEMSYVIDYNNVNYDSVGDLLIKAEFPEGFRFNLAQPMPSEEETTWNIGSLSKGQNGKITIMGQLYGNNNEEKMVVFYLGRADDEGKFVAFNRQEGKTKIILPSLSIDQSVETMKGPVNKIIKAGDVLKYKINYKNNEDIAIRDSVITAEIRGKVLDFSKIEIEKGFFDEKNKTITWKSSDLPELKSINPGGGGTLSFSVPVKSWIPVEGKMDNNYIVSSTLKIDSADIPLSNNGERIFGSNKLELALASKVLLSTKAYFEDSNIKNYGPMPMKIGSETTFAVHWRIDSISSKITNTKVVASLPTGVKWTGNTYPINEKITYNDRTNQLIWSVGDVEAGTGVFVENEGVLIPAKEVVFQVAVTPQTNQAGEAIDLVNESVLTARESFVAQDLVVKGEKKDTLLPEDPAVGYVNGKVPMPTGNTQ